MTFRETLAIQMPVVALALLVVIMAVGAALLGLLEHHKLHDCSE